MNVLSQATDRYNEAKVDTPAVREAIALIAEVYLHSDVGGGLHVVVDDWNLEDHHIASLLVAVEGTHIFDSQGAAEVACAKALLAMSLEERATALALFEGFFDFGE